MYILFMKLVPGSCVPNSAYNTDSIIIHEYWDNYATVPGNVSSYVYWGYQRERTYIHTVDICTVSHQCEYGSAVQVLLSHKTPCYTLNRKTTSPHHVALCAFSTTLLFWMTSRKNCTGSVWIRSGCILGVVVETSYIWNFLHNFDSENLAWYCEWLSCGRQGNVDYRMTGCRGHTWRHPAVSWIYGGIPGEWTDLHGCRKQVRTPRIHKVSHLKVFG